MTAKSRTTAPRLVAPLALFLLVALPLPFALRFDHGHYITAAILIVLLAGLSLWSRTSGIAATLLYLMIMGDYRRYASFFQGYPFSDPLLLVAPVSAFVLAVMVFLDGRAKGMSMLGALIGIFALLMFAEIFNPLQGGIAVGFAGALFYFVPMLWFWVGRAYGQPALVEQLVLKLMIPAAVCTALLGTYQAFYGLLPFEAAWAKEVQFGALYVSGNPRPLGFFTSPAEHVRFLLIASVSIVAIWLRSRSRVILLLPLLLVSMFLGGSRGPIVMFVLTCAVLWAVLTRSSTLWFPRAGLAAIIAAGTVGAGLTFLEQAHFNSRIDALVTHQVEGLLNPTDTEKSTAVGHVALATEGLMDGVTSPAGKGLGATTLAASKYGEGAYSAEVDLANMFYSLGIIGGLLYISIIIAAIASALTLWRERRGTVQLVMLGTILSTLSAWLLGGEYANGAIIWLLLGAIDRGTLDVAAERAARRRNAYRLSHA
jgi:hypothetical protein